jgi:hypothetical protein
MTAEVTPVADRTLEKEYFCDVEKGDESRNLEDREQHRAKRNVMTENPYHGASFDFPFTPLGREHRILCRNV